MSTGLSVNNPTIVSAFYNELLRQGLVVALIVLLVAAAWSVTRSAQLRRAAMVRQGQARDLTASAPEAPARRLLRISFGILWIFDGILQGQASMPLGMAPSVIQPAAATSPGWVQHFDNAIVTVWTYHPVAAPAAVVWIQVGLGVWLLAASKGTWSRLGGVATVAWGLIVWMFGEAFGQIFAPGQSWMFGLPGSVLLYCAAGALIALPEAVWHTPRLGRWILGTVGAFWVGMAFLQAWPGRGFWQGQTTGRGTPGAVVAMAQDMASTPQPHVLASWVGTFARFAAAHGWAVNLFVVVALAAIGALLITARPRLVLPAAIASTVLCLADWVFVQDLGFMGGVGTDPNSMPPMIALIWAGYVALTRVPAPIPAPAQANAGTGESAAGAPWRDRLAANPTYAFRTAAAIGALAITLVGTAPMAVAASNSNADPLLAQAVDGSPEAFNFAEPALDLVDQNGHPVTLSSLRGKAVALTYLDPVCTSDCPVIAQEFRQADRILGSASRRVYFVAVDANPRYIATAYLDAFDHQEGLQHTPNWLYLTGTLPQLQHAWRALGALIEYEPGGAMIDHTEYAYVIDPSGRVRYTLDTDPGPATGATESSFAVTLASTLKKALKEK